MKKKVVSVILFREGERILIQDRNPWDKYGYDYGFFGGKIEQGETPEQTLKRELKEELDINLISFKFIKHVKKQIPELDLEIEFYLYTAPIPDLNKIKCIEGKPFLTDFKTALKLRFNPADLEVLMLSQVAILTCFCLLLSFARYNHNIISLLIIDKIISL